MQGRIAQEVLLVELGAVLDEPAHSLRVVEPARPVQGRVLGLVQRVYRHGLLLLLLFLLLLVLVFIILLLA